MLIAVLSDLHANKYALSAVEKDYRFQKAEAIWLLGDIFGRGPHPREMIKWMKDNFAWYKPRNKWVAGNHDENVFGWNIHHELLIPPHIKEVDEEHGRLIITDRSGQKLISDRSKLKPLIIEKDDGYYCLRHKFSELGYLYPWCPFTIRDAIESLEALCNGTVVLSGHSHIPMLARDDPEKKIHIEPIEPCIEYGFDMTHKWIINPGSVGAPADLDNRASYALLDTRKRTVQFRKVAYNFNLTADDSMAKNYSNILWEQLEKACLPDLDVPEFWVKHFNMVGQANCSQEK